ncbi:E3 ubiquitin-protein ligase TRIM35-like [Silurus meridionalis]|uniref:E3 ubiquitin-protein ligase TRIM35-like n=1 Tax=Silurus meridionalis TaxID=175797 RepID=UPI001EEBA2BF|nr:E3 ubiquitin-protein ligase TRIM35-like [Silurus meridionalis]
MDSRPSLTEDDFSCPVCCDIFSEPLLLACSHSICKRCLHTFWQQRGVLECPICRTVSSSFEPPVNIVLHNMCEAVLRERNRRMSVEMEGLCSIHRESLSLFCVKDQRPLCTKCKNSRLHSRHTVCSIQEASQDLKSALQMKLKTLLEKIKIYEDFKQSCINTGNHIKKQSQTTETLIRSEFQRFHQFLWDEEEARIAALKKDEEQKSQIMKTKIDKITIQISSVLDTIKAVEKQIQGDNLSFLLNYKASLERTQAKLENPEKLSGVLINVANHLSNLMFQVSGKMQSLVQYSDFYIIIPFDPNTAHAGLMVSDDLITVEYKGELQQLPNNSERFEGYISVIGSEGLNSGTPYWDVEVGDNTAWAVGIISESVYEHRENLSRFGLWYVGFCNGKYGKGYAPEILTLLRVSDKIERIRVQVDFNKGKVIFTDSDRNICLHIFKQSFRERVFPYFYSHCKLHPLRILPLKSSVTIQMDR